MTSAAQAGPCPCCAQAPPGPGNRLPTHVQGLSDVPPALVQGTQLRHSLKPLVPVPGCAVTLGGLSALVHRSCGPMTSLSLRLVSRQVLCGIGGIAAYVGVAIAFRPSVLERLGVSGALELLWIAAAGYIAATVLCIPVLVLSWRSSAWWVGTLFSAIAGLFGAGLAYKLSWSRTQMLRLEEALLLACLALPVAAISIGVHQAGRRRDARVQMRSTVPSHRRAMG